MFEIKKAEITDIPTIIDIAQRTWPDTYQHILSKAQLDYMMQMMYNPIVLQKDIEDRGSFVLAYNDQQEALAFASFDWYEPSTYTYKLHKLYALPQSQQKGLGRFLINYVASNARQNGAKRLILNVNRLNSALDFYLKMGFQIIEQVDIYVENGYYMNDYIMEKILD